MIEIRSLIDLDEQIGESDEISRFFPEVVEHYREAHDVALSNADGGSDTVDLRTEPPPPPPRLSEQFGSTADAQPRQRTGRYRQDDAEGHARKDASSPTKWVELQDG